jgi:hypothetical protein
MRGAWRPAGLDGRAREAHLARHRPIHYHRARLAAAEIAYPVGGSSARGRPFAARAGNLDDRPRMPVRLRLAATAASPSTPGPRAELQRTAGALFPAATIARPDALKRKARPAKEAPGRPVRDMQWSRPIGSESVHQAIGLCPGHDQHVQVLPFLLGRLAPRAAGRSVIGVGHAYQAHTGRAKADVCRVESPLCGAAVAARLFPPRNTDAGGVTIFPSLAKVPKRSWR